MNEDGEGPGLRAQWQFGRQARYYAESVAHREGESLELIARLAALGSYRWVVDLGAGAGFTAFALVPYAQRVLATDVTLPMLLQARHLAQERDITNVDYVQGTAGALPFASASLDLLACRLAAHHFAPPAVREAFAIKPRGEELEFSWPCLVIRAVKLLPGS